MNLRQGQLKLSVPNTNRTAQYFSLQNLDAEILFQPGDHWELRNFQAQTFGVGIQLTGYLTNASFLSHWQWPEPVEKKVPSTQFWYRLLKELDNACLRRVDITGGIMLVRTKIGADGGSRNDSNYIVVNRSNMQQILRKRALVFLKLEVVFLFRKILRHGDQFVSDMIPPLGGFLGSRTNSVLTSHDSGRRENHQQGKARDISS